MLNRKVLKQRDTKQTTDISVKRTEALHQSSLLLLSMCHKGSSTHRRRWTLMSPHTSGGISFLISICCRLLSILLLLVEWNGFFYICTVIVVALVHCFSVSLCSPQCRVTVEGSILSTDPKRLDVDTLVCLSGFSSRVLWKWLGKVNTNTTSIPFHYLIYLHIPLLLYLNFCQLLRITSIY